MSEKKLSLDLREAFEGRGLSQKEIEEMDADDLFYEYCQWNGLIGWGRHLAARLDELREAKNG